MFIILNIYNDICFVVFCYLNRKFDLKGSTVDREASEKELEKHLPTYKDNDFIKQKVKLEIGEEPKKKLLDTLGNDIDVSILHIMCQIYIQNYT